MKTTSNEYKHFEPQLEERAFLYQQIQELAELGVELGSMTIQCEKADESEQYAVKLILDSEGVNFESRGEGSDVYEAAIEAKKTMAKSLELLTTQVNGQERLAKIQFITSGHQLH